jgi:dethiobiotin synthetase
MTQTFFITATGTGVGKTLLTCSLARQLIEAGKRVTAVKPVISGYDPGDNMSDTAQILRSQNLPVTVPNVEAISPWRFKAAVSPNVAAERENRVIEFGDLCQFSLMPRISEIVLIEGAGGVMSPLDHSRDMLDWMTTLNVPIILVVGTYLGSLSHALTAASVIHARGAKIQALVISESEDSAMSLEETALQLKRSVPYAKFVVPLPRVAGEGELWQHSADMTWMLT